MKKEVRILILEDVPVDAELMEHELHKGRIEFSAKHVETFEETSYKSPAPFIEAMVVGLLDVGAVGNWGVLLLAWVMRFRTKEDMNHEKASQT